MAYMVRILCLVVFCVAVQQHQPAAALTCYSCSTNPSSCTCCSDLDNGPTCQGGGCATVYYPDGNVTRKCDENVRHGCTDVGDDVVACGCHEELCNLDACQQQSNCTSSAAPVFPSSRGLTFTFTFASILGLRIN